MCKNIVLKQGIHSDQISAFKSSSLPSSFVLDSSSLFSSFLPVNLSRRAALEPTTPAFWNEKEEGKFPKRHTGIRG